MLDRTVSSACGSDLMSDVLAFVKEQTLLLTGLTNHHVIRTAELLDVSAIVFVEVNIRHQKLLTWLKSNPLY